MAFPSPLFDQLQTRRLNLLPILLQRRKGRREDLGLPDPRDCVLTLVMNMQALQPVVSRIRQPFVLQLMPILMLLIPTLMTVSLKTALWLQQSVRLILWNVLKTFNVISTDSPVSKSCADTHLDLTNCDSVVYEMKDGIPGMKFTADGRDGWTPVRKRRCQTKSKMPRQRSVSSDTESSSSDIDVSCCRRVEVLHPIIQESRTWGMCA